MTDFDPDEPPANILDIWPALAKAPPAPKPHPISAYALQSITRAYQQLHRGGPLADGADPQWVATRLHLIASAIAGDDDWWNRPGPALNNKEAHHCG